MNLTEIVLLTTSALFFLIIPISHLYLIPKFRSIMFELSACMLRFYAPDGGVINLKIKVSPSGKLRGFRINTAKEFLGSCLVEIEKVQDTADPYELVIKNEKSNPLHMTLFGFQQHISWAADQEGPPENGPYKSNNYDSYP